LSGGFRIPDVSRVLPKEFDDAFENFPVGEGLGAGFAIEDWNGHAPDTLARNTPVGTHGDHVRNAFFAPSWMPLHPFDGFERAGAQLLAVHPDEPLFGGTEDGGLVAAPAVRVAVVQFLLTQQRTVLLQNLDDNRVRLPHRQAEDLLRQRAIGAVGVEETAGRVNWAVYGQPVSLAAHKVFLAMAGGRVDRAGALLQRDVVRQDADGG